MTVIIKIYDTSSLLLLSEELFKTDERIVVTSVTLQELENIKVSANKDANIKYAARQVLRLLNENPDKYICELYLSSYEKTLKKYNLEPTNDMKILVTAYWYKTKNPKEEVYFCTNDLALKRLAEIFFSQQNILSIDIENDTYTGYVDFYLDQEQMIDFYSDLTKHGEGLYTNQYINVYEQETLKRVDTLCWDGSQFRPLKYKDFSSKQLGNIKPYKDDIYQAMAADSLINNKITMIKGPAGTGKSLLALGYLFSCLEKGKIDKIIIFCNTVATKGAAKLGFYPGRKDEKLLDSSIGNFLAAKLGSKMAVEQLIETEKLLLLPMCDIRGYDSTGMKAGIYISEAQNLDIQLLKLALQRTGEDAIFILDGDTKSQVDMVEYEGANNGMRRVSQVFRGEDIYGEIELNQIHRSRIATIADKM